MSHGTDHIFGGLHTDQKLRLLEDYLSFYTTALKNTRFTLYYIDAFAGSGNYRLPGFDVTENENAIVQIEDTGHRQGSARRALACDPPFHRYAFVEQHQGRLSQLRTIAQEHENLRVDVIGGDANREVVRLLSTVDWQSSRGVIFLDPYGMSVERETLQAIRRTGALDLWYFFPTSALVRQLANDFGKIDDAKQAAIARLLGPGWEEKLYAEDRAQSLFDVEPREPERYRYADVARIRQIVRDGLAGIFPYVQEPVRLPRSGSHFFDFYFALSNDSPKAIALARKVAQQIMKRI